MSYTALLTYEIALKRVRFESVRRAVRRGRKIQRKLLYLPALMETVIEFVRVIEPSIGLSSILDIESSQSLMLRNRTETCHGCMVARSRDYKRL